MPVLFNLAKKKPDHRHEMARCMRMVAGRDVRAPGARASRPPNPERGCLVRKVNIVEQPHKLTLIRF